MLLQEHRQEEQRRLLEEQQQLLTARLNEVNDAVKEGQQPQQQQLVEGVDDVDHHFETVQIVVPPGAVGGTPSGNGLKVRHGNRTLTINLPPGAQPGQRVTMRVPRVHTVELGAEDEVPPLPSSSCSCSSCCCYCCWHLHSDPACVAMLSHLTMVLALLALLLRW